MIVYSDLSSITVMLSLCESDYKPAFVNVISVIAVSIRDEILRMSLRRLVEAAGIEPLLLLNPNLMMANDFGFYGVKNYELQRRFDSPGVPSRPLESSPVLEK